jgi:hypothetical protein
MRFSSVNFLLPLALCGMLAGCGGNPGGSALTASADAAVGTTQTQRVARVVATAAPAGTYWAGTVSGVSGNGIVANCGQSNFAEEYGCLPVVTTGAVVSGTPQTGGYFQLWGDLSKLPNITATTINYASTPFPATVGTATPTPAAPSTTPNWSGVVSAFSGPAFTANCGQSNFAAGYGCIPVSMAGATIVGTIAVGASFQLWGDLSKLPNVTATYVVFSATPFASPSPSVHATATPVATSAATAKPALTPVLVPTAVPQIAGGTFMNFSNAQDYSTSFVPYASNSVWNTPVSTHPTYLSSSAAIVAAQFPGGNNTQTIRANEAGVYDYSHPRYFASNADPVVALRCTLYCGAPDNGGVPATAHIPALARPALGSDAHIDVVQADGTEICAWGVTQPGANWATGQTLTALNIANCGSFSSGAGWLSNGPGPTAAGFALQSGIITAAELIAGQINHAIFITGQCAIGSQYPSEPGASTDQCTSGLGPPLGGREWYDVPCSTTQANSALRPWEKAILCAMNIYGGYMGDDVGGGSTFTGTGAGVESEEPWYAYQGPGYTSPFAPLAAQGWGTIHMLNVIGNQSGTRWVGADPWQPAGVNFAAHIHWLDPCSARGAC